MGDHNHAMHTTSAMPLGASGRDGMDHTAHGAHGGHGGHEGMAHAMAFHFGMKEMILFDFWMVNSSIGIIISSLIVVVMCFLLEGIRWFRAFRRQTSPQPADSILRRINILLLADGVLHAIQLTLGYSLMLVFMTFNVWLCAATVLGEVLAHLTFRVLLPQLEATVASAATTESCCG